MLARLTTGFRRFCFALCASAAIVCGITGAAAREGRGPNTASIVQFFVDPTLPDQGWIVTANAVQFNSGIKTGGRWAIKFDRDVFQRVAGVEPLSAFRIVKIQASRARRGAVFLLVDNAGETTDSFQRYVVLSMDGGESWKVAQKGTVAPTRVITAAPVPTPTPRPPLTPGGEADQAGMRLAKPSTPMRVQMEREHGAPPPAGAVVPASHVPSREEAMLENAGHHPAGVSPLFNLMFDLWLDVRPGVTPLTFDSYHTLILLDLHPSKDLQFSAEVSPTPRYYEITYRATPDLEFRGGKIWIPFDEMNPHEIYGGFYNIDRLREPGSMAFLPELWTDLGLAMKYRLVHTAKTDIDVQAYVVNGFGEGGTDPLNQVGTRYPNFDGNTLTDNNSDKALGLRLHGSYDHWFGLGASFYEGRYTNDKDADRRLWMLGADLQLRYNGTKLKTGYILMNVDLPSPSRVPDLQRNGFYAELTQRLSDRWRLIGRGGSETDDSRIVTVGNRTLIGGELVYSYSYFQFSLLYYKDLYKIRGKANYEMTGLRATAMF